MPPPERTLSLLRQYFSNTCLLFPYIDRESFLATYHELAASGFAKVRRSWLGLLNLILAMAVSASEDGGLDARGRRAESGIFFRRAMALCEKQIRFGASLEIGM
ncbi:fungal specific transcription factor domain-containing protein [Candidatus Bathyarchaeota archaeon]|nr:fungal specific transcription factor domain-containing protein [Candidatus Bathyarchaeota archaeon]